MTRPLAAIRADLTALDKEIAALLTRRAELRIEFESKRGRATRTADLIREAIATAGRPLHYREIAQMTGLTAANVAAQLSLHVELFRRIGGGVHTLVGGDE